MHVPTIQYTDRPGLIDLGWGHPAPAALPVDLWRDCHAEALRTFSWQALTYGYAAGPAPLVEWWCERLGHTDGRAPTPPEVFVTAGASQALDLVAALLARPGDTVLVGSPTYHLALRILADHGLDLVDAPGDDAGTDPVATRELLHRLADEGRRVPLLYLVPTFANPTGTSLPADRRRALVEVAHGCGVTIVEDDTYRELGYDGLAPPSLWSLGPDAVVRVGSFAKTVGPGLRLGWLTARPELVRALLARGFVHSGGGLNHTTALAMAVMGTSGRYAAHVDRIRAVYRRQRDSLVTALRQAAAVDCAVPHGGWFLWPRLPAGLSATGLLARAEAHGVSFLPGRLFYARPPADDRVRLSFSMYEPEPLAEAARRLARALAGSVGASR